MATALQPETGASSAIHCRRCSKFLGESATPQEFVGVVLPRDLIELVPRPRSTWKCKCGWTNIFQPAAAV